MIDVGKGPPSSVAPPGVNDQNNLLYVPQERLIDLRPFALGQVTNQGFFYLSASSPSDHREGKCDSSREILV